MVPAGAAKTRTVCDLLTAARQPSVTWSGWWACHQATGLPPCGARLQHGVQLAHRQQHGPAREDLRQPVHVGGGAEALLQQQLEELVAPAAVGAGPGDRAGRFDDQGRAEIVLDEDESAGDAEDGLFGHAPLRILLLASGDAAHRALELVLRDLDDLRGDAGRVGEREDGGLVADEQHRAGAFLVGVAGGAAGGAVVTARGVVADEQPVGFVVADLGAYVLADVEHARHGGSSNSVRGPGGSRAP